MEIEFNFEKNEFVHNPGDIKNFVLQRIESIQLDGEFLNAVDISKNIIQIQHPSHVLLIKLVKRYHLRQVSETTGLLTSEFNDSDYSAF